MDNSLRLLPWTTPEGKPCYLRTDGHGRISHLADTIEAEQLSWAGTILDRSAALLRTGHGTEPELRFLIARLREALTDTLRIAESRGTRLSTAPNDFEKPDE